MTPKCHIVESPETWLKHYTKNITPPVALPLQVSRMGRPGVWKPRQSAARQHQHAASDSSSSLERNPEQRSVERGAELGAAKQLSTRLAEGGNSGATVSQGLNPCITIFFY